MDLYAGGRGDAAAPIKVALAQQAVLATWHGETLIFGIRDGRIITIRRRGDDGIDTVEWGQLRGLRITVHRKVLDTGLLDTGYNLKHPDFGEVEIHALELPGADSEGFLDAVRPFTAAGLGH